MNWQLITKWVVGFSVIGLVIYDIVAIVQGGKESSISWFIISNESKFPAFCTGVLCGHLYWRMKNPTKGKDL